MKENKEKTYLKEVVIGFILEFISVALFVVCLILSNYYFLSDLSTSWFLFLILGIGIICFIIGFIFLKKFNKKRLNYLLKQNDKTKEFEELLNKKYEELNKKEENDKK